MILLASLISAEISKCFKTVNKIHRSNAPGKKSWFYHTYFLIKTAWSLMWKPNILQPRTAKNIPWFLSQIY